MKAKETRAREMILKENKDKEVVSKTRIKEINRIADKTPQVFSRAPVLPGPFLYKIFLDGLYFRRTSARASVSIFYNI